ncbi:hypothetical protein HYC85_020139 [Camellia sinensis]|uniref:Uncharacterized protein n=1 Tax=Camellia sinensis TaxID=4442 RepID=A0A7J7GPT4_CAMSI|nr:hypothetical protein HYC85_020139 [Camellia sinensis]
MAESSGRGAKKGPDTVITAPKKKVTEMMFESGVPLFKNTNDNKKKEISENNNNKINNKKKKISPVGGERFRFRISTASTVCTGSISLISISSESLISISKLHRHHHLHQRAHVQACVPDVLKVALHCLDNLIDSDGSLRALRTKIANFLANNLNRNWPRDLYEKMECILFQWVLEMMINAWKMTLFLKG